MVQPPFQNDEQGKNKEITIRLAQRCSHLELPKRIELKDRFFRLMHLFKVKANLSDYFDLNRRYFGTTDTVLFKDNRVELSPVPK